ncbi:MAG: tellurite resistance/C4-dicarboxylate transporter family protein [Myxococcales bacterium]|nr:tellurite resistance/C4-dicarboxylate transporter family protein [Myxococcales bacterium]
MAHLRQFLLAHCRRLDPGCFALVMATGIVSIDASQHGMPQLALALLIVNAAAYLWLLGLSALRLWRFPVRVLADFANPRRASGFLTLTAATCVLGSQCLLVVHVRALAGGLALAGALLWFALLYPLCVVAITRHHKPGFSRSINGGWLVSVVATQALAVLAILLASGSNEGSGLLFAGLCLLLLGAGLYVLIIILIVSRLFFFPLRALEFRAPYWIDMGALAITTLAGSLYVEHAVGSLVGFVPFVRGLTLFTWAAASAWIPLLIMLELWRYLWRRVPLRYEPDAWDIVFPIGMYTVSTFVLARALELPFLLIVPEAGGYVSLAVWALVAIGLIARLRREGWS